MNRRTFLKTAAATGLLGIAGTRLSAAARSGSRTRSRRSGGRPNLVVIYCDDLGYGDLGFTGHPIIKTPNIDALAAEGVIFTQNYSGAPHCSPSRAVLLTGRASYRFGFYDIAGRGDMELPESEITVAEILRDAGYDTYHGGKWHLNKGKAPDPALKHGFNYTADSGMAVNVIADFADWLGAQYDKTKPAFAYLALHETHEPVEARSPESDRKPYLDIDPQTFAKVKYGGEGVARNKAKASKVSAYYGCVAQLDRAIGTLVECLKTRGLWDNTFIYFSSDNGPEHRAAASWGTPGHLRGAKGHMHDGGIHVPGFAVWPGRIKPRTTSDVPVHAWDLLPTLCEITRLDTPSNIDGASFLPATQGQPIDRRTPMYWSWWNARGGTNYVIRDGDYKLLAVAAPKPKNKTVVEHIKAGEIESYELYNLKDDPGEHTNLVDTHPRQFGKLKARFLALHTDIIAEAPLLRMNGDNKENTAWPKPNPR